MAFSLLQKLAILADAAKYDASCVSSGGVRRTAGKGIGSTTGQGICHAFTPDGRCVSLLKILLTNFCRYDCAYCVSRRSSNVPRARFSVEEVVRLTLDLYRRNCIEGLFLSSGIVRYPDETMSDLIRVARLLRQEHAFRGYIHLKTIPGASEELLAEAGLYADRLSMNVELPTESSLKALAPEKSTAEIKKGLATTRAQIEASSERSPGKARPRRYAPAGQSTQMVVGADTSSDVAILRTSAQLYASYALQRVYYSAFSPTEHASDRLLPATATPLMREHRLYQADWLLRFYGFALSDIEAATPTGMLDLKVDPKMAWALAHRAFFPLDINLATREQLLRVPGLGTRAVDRIVGSRRHGSLRLADVARLTSSVARARPFIITPDWHPGPLLDSPALAQRLRFKPRQLSLGLA